LKTTLGLDLPDKPETAIPHLPPDLTNVSSRDLGELATRIGIWAAFLAPQIIIAKATADDLKVSADWAKKIEGDERKSLELMRTRTEKKAEAELIEALYKSVMRMKETVSREIARIDGDQPKPPNEPPTVVPTPTQPVAPYNPQPAPPWAFPGNS